MCIFCGGACGGIGDMLLPTLATGAGLVMFKIKARRESCKERNQHGTSDNESAGEIALGQTKQSSANVDNIY